MFGLFSLLMTDGVDDPRVEDAAMSDSLCKIPRSLLNIYTPRLALTASTLTGLQTHSFSSGSSELQAIKFPDHTSTLQVTTDPIPITLLSRVRKDMLQEKSSWQAGPWAYMY